MNKNKWIALLAILLFITIISASTTYCKNESKVQKAEAQLQDYTKVKFQLDDINIALKEKKDEYDKIKKERDELRTRINNFDADKLIVENERDLYHKALVSSVKHIVYLQDVMNANGVIYPEFIVDLPLKVEDLLK